MATPDGQLPPDLRAQIEEARKALRESIALAVAALILSVAVTGVLAILLLARLAG